MAQYGSAADHDEIAPGVEHPSRVFGVHHFARRAEANVSARQIRKKAHQRPASEPFILGLLADIPQRHVEEIDLFLPQNFGRHIAHFVEFETEALGREPEAKLKIGPGYGADAVDDFEDDPRAVLDTATIAVCSPVACPRQELGEYIAVCAMNLDAVKARLLGAPCAHDKIVAQCLDLGFGQSPDVAFGDFRRRDWRVDKIGFGATARVMQL